MNQPNSNSDYQSRVLTIEAYSAWTREMVEERWTAYFANFMFNSLSGRQVRYQMKDEVHRVYQTLVTRVVRYPRSPAWVQWLPRFFGCPDFPVYKREKISSGDVFVNGGWHYNGLYFIPPVSRLPCSLGEHFEKHKVRYAGQGRPLNRIHTTEMNYGDMTEYALKAYKNGRTSYDNVLVLPRSLSELPT